MKLALKILVFFALFETGVITVSRFAGSSYPSVYPGPVREVSVAEPDRTPLTLAKDELVGRYSLTPEIGVILHADDHAGDFRGWSYLGYGDDCFGGGTREAPVHEAGWWAVSNSTVRVSLEDRVDEYRVIAWDRRPALLDANGNLYLRARAPQLEK